MTILSFYTFYTSVSVDLLPFATPISEYRHFRQAGNLLLWIWRDKSTVSSSPRGPCERIMPPYLSHQRDHLLARSAVPAWFCRPVGMMNDPEALPHVIHTLYSFLLVSTTSHGLSQMLSHCAETINVIGTVLCLLLAACHSSKTTAKKSLFF
jgi:hypothetical protein